MNRMNKMIRNLAGLLAIALIAASSAIPAEASNKVKAKYGIDGYTIANLPEKATLNALVDSAHKVDARAFLSLYQHDSKYLEFEGDKDQAGNTVTLQAGKRYHIMADCINYGKEDAKSVHFSLKLPQQIKAGGTSRMTAKFTPGNHPYCQAMQIQLDHLLHPPQNCLRSHSYIYRKRKNASP